MASVLARLPLRAPSDLVIKIDSTLRGNVGPALSAAHERFPEAIVLVAPSLPAQGRTLRDGVLSVHGKRTRVVAPQDRLPLAVVRAGVAAVTQEIAAFRARGIWCAWADAESDDDLHTLVAGGCVRSDVLWIGSTGIIRAIARATTGSQTSRARCDERTEPSMHHRVLFLIGSLHDVARSQIAAFARNVPTEILDPHAILRHDPEIEAAIARTARALRDGGAALVALAATPHVADPRLRAAFVAACTPLAADAANLAVVLCGGETARAFCDAFALRSLEPIDEIVPGMPRLQAANVAFHLVTKAGGFGEPNAFEHVRRILTGKATA